MRADQFGLPWFHMFQRVHAFAGIILSHHTVEMLDEIKRELVGAMVRNQESRARGEW